MSLPTYQEQSHVELTEGVQPEVAEKILQLQDRCVNCGSAYALHIHHRIFRSETDNGLQRFLSRALLFYKATYKRQISPWRMHDIQNLVVLCNHCHEYPVVGVHGGNKRLNKWLRNTFTCPKTGFIIPYAKVC